MRIFSMWLAVSLIACGILAGSYHLYLTRNPRKVFVAVDASFPMRSVWRQVPKLLVRIGRQRYSQYTLVTEKNRIHGWSSSLDLGDVSPYAPREFSNITDMKKFPELREATEKIFVTNADAAETEVLRNWKVIRLTLRY